MKRDSTAFLVKKIYLLGNIYLTIFVGQNSGSVTHIDHGFKNNKYKSRIYVSGQIIIRLCGL